MESQILLQAPTQGPAVQPSVPGQKAEGQLLVKLTYKPFEDDETDTGYKEAEAYALMLQEQAITDIKSAAGMQNNHTSSWMSLPAMCARDCLMLLIGGNRLGCISMKCSMKGFLSGCQRAKDCADASSRAAVAASAAAAAIAVTKVIPPASSAQGISHLVRVSFIMHDKPARFFDSVTLSIMGMDLHNRQRRPEQLRKQH